MPFLHCRLSALPCICRKCLIRRRRRW